jgi:hypothetical protein
VAIAGLTVESDQLVPDVLDTRVHDAVADAVAEGGDRVRGRRPEAAERTPAGLAEPPAPAGVRPRGA